MEKMLKKLFLELQNKVPNSKYKGMSLLHPRFTAFVSALRKKLRKYFLQKIYISIIYYYGNFHVGGKISEIFAKNHEKSHKRELDFACV